MAYPEIGYIESEYLNLLQRVMEDGSPRSSRTGIRTHALFGERIKGPIGVDFPLLTTKKVFWKGVVEELLWMISGSTNARDLSSKGVHIWDAWADPETGELGPIYSAQWRKWPGPNGTIDQLAGVINAIQHEPDSRRLLINSWNVGHLSSMKLPPCHYTFQFFCDTIHHPVCQENFDKGATRCCCDAPHFTGPPKEYPKRYLDCMVTMRSCDIFLGLPFNIASYALLTHLIGRVTDRHPRNLIMSLGDVHLYDNHREVAAEQLKRSPLAPPKLDLSNAPYDSIDSFKSEHIVLRDYKSHGTLKAEIAV